MTSESKTFQPTETSINAARDFAREILVRGGHAHEDVVLVVSELATNAVRHARTTFTVTVRDDGSGVEIGVSDGSRHLPVVRKMSGTAEGYGLVIIDQISRDWGVEQSSKGKRVWARFQYSAPEASEC